MLEHWALTSLSNADACGIHKTLSSVISGFIFTSMKPHSLDLTRILCCAVGTSSNNPFSVGTWQVMNKYVMYEFMESSKHFMYVRRIIASLSGRVETTKRYNETTKRRNDKGDQPTN